MTVSENIVACVGMLYFQKSYLVTTRSCYLISKPSTSSTNKFKLSSPLHYNTLISSQLCLSPGIFSLMTLFFFSCSVRRYTINLRLDLHGHKLSHV